MAFLLNRFLSPDNPGALANANFDEDFGPTRDRTIAGSGQFTYKHSKGETNATETSRGTLVDYYPSIFGEIVEMTEVRISSCC
jgi:hypothetical protein